MNYESIAARIIQLKDEDLALRDKLLQSGQLDEGYHPEMEQLHQHNTAALNDIIDSIGYPTIDKVGAAANEAAWLVIQHAIAQPKFMKKCAKLLASAVEKQQASRTNLAYLTDRIAVYENLPQHYGTQFDWDENGALSPQPFDDLAKVNQRRKSIGLNTLEEQTDLIRKQAKKDNHGPPKDLQERQKEFEQWKKKVGWSK